MNQIASIFVKRSQFNLSHTRAFDCDMGDLVPIMCEEVLPGDSWKVNTDMLVRMGPMIGPMYHDVNVFTRFFFVPNRIIWSEWEKFITAGPSGTDAPTHPYFVGRFASKYSLEDYFGLPIGVPKDISVLPFRAYNQIYNDWFMNQTLDSKLAISTASGADVTTVGILQKVKWEKDYFTCSMPNTQRGNPVTLPLGTTAPVTLTGGALPVVSYSVADGEDQVTAGPYVPTNPNVFATGATTGANLRASTTDTAQQANTITGEADLTNATASTVNDLRLAFQIQRLLERLMRAGSRYVEYLLAVFGVRSPDARLQRAEYLGGGKSPLVVSEVIQTSQTDTTPQGHLAGHGFSAHRSHSFTKSFTEHGFIIGLMYVLPRTVYQQGLQRFWSRSSRFDYYVPAFAHLGEQAVLKKEVYCANDGHDDEPFGYQGRYDELRRRESIVAGDFRNPNGYGTWAMTRIFSARPTLNSAFVTADPSSNVFAAPLAKNVLVYLKNNSKAIRPMPKLGEPGFIDH